MKAAFYRARVQRHFASLWVVSACALVLPFPSLGYASETRSTQEDCKARVDAQHACACNDIRGENPIDVGAFNLARPDIQAVYLALQSSPDFKPEGQSQLIEALRQKYEEHRELLSCHDRVALRTSDFIMAEDYCVHEPAVAYALQKPICDQSGSQEQNAAKEKVQAQVQKIFGSFERQLERLTYCDAGQTHAKTFMRGIAVQYPPCKIDLKSLFPNNVSTLTPAQTQKLTQYIQSHECYQRAIKNELKLEKIEISSSSSRLANTGIASNKSFLTLSQERALEIENKLVRPLFSESILHSVALDNSFKGSNGDGTSGACPYAFDSQKRTWFRKPFPTNEQLESNKKTELNLYFGERTKPIHSNHHTSMMAAPCKRAVFYCR